MSKFLSELVTVKVDSFAKQNDFWNVLTLGLAPKEKSIWKIHEPFTYQSDVLGKTITVEEGFLTDFASVPRLPLIYFVFGDTSHKAAVIHDWLYHHHEVCDKDMADLVLREAAQVEGISHWRRMGIYLGVKFGGKSSWEDDDASGNGHSIVDGKIV